MRHALVRIALLGALVLSACAPPAPTTGGSTGQPPAAQPPSKLSIGISNLVVSLHPFTTVAFAVRRYHIFDMLVGQKADGSVEPMLSTEWKLLNETTWQFKMRNDVTFHDGSKLTADDAKFSIDAAFDPDKKYPLLARLPTLKSTEKVDDYTINVLTKTPDPILLKRMALISIMPKAVASRQSDDEFGQKAIGSGPYRVKSFKSEDILELTAVREHPFRKPTIQEITIRNIREASARIAGLRSGELDFADFVPIDNVETLRSAGFQINTSSSGQSLGFFIDTVNGDRPVTGPTGDKRVRQALNYAVDRDGINKNIFKGLTLPEQGQPVQKETFGFHPNLKPYPYDPAKARQLLAEAGYANGVKVTLEYTKSFAEAEQMVLAVQQYAKDVGIDLQIQLLADNALFLDKFYGRQERANVFTAGLFNAPAMDADFVLTWYCGCQPAGSRHFNHPEFDKNYVASTGELNEQKRRELLWKALEIMHEEVPTLFLVQQVRIQAYKNGLKGIVPRTDNEPNFPTLTW